MHGDKHGANNTTGNGSRGEGAFENRTVVIIAHRLSTIRHADQIVVMDKGVIVEVGNHELLMKYKGFYFRLIESQNEHMDR